VVPSGVLIDSVEAPRCRRTPHRPSQNRAAW
jgi:hypothetical protein